MLLFTVTAVLCCLRRAAPCTAVQRHGGGSHAAALGQRPHSVRFRDRSLACSCAVSPPTHLAARRAGLLALPPSGDAATGGCSTTAGLRALFVLSYRPYPCLIACPTLSASGAVVFPPACNMGRVPVSRPPPPTVSSSSSREHTHTHTHARHTSWDFASRHLRGGIWAADGCPADRHGACKMEPPRDAIGGQIILALDSRQG